LSEKCETVAESNSGESAGTVGTRTTPFSLHLIALQQPMGVTGLIISCKVYTNKKTNTHTHTISLCPQFIALKHIVGGSQLGSALDVGRYSRLVSKYSRLVSKTPLGVYVNASVLKLVLMCRCFWCWFGSGGSQFESFPSWLQVSALPHTIWSYQNGETVSHFPGV